jgi:hypothetical protein
MTPKALQPSPSRRNGFHWVLGLICAFLLTFIANGILVWLALSGAPEIDPTYEQQPR